MASSLCGHCAPTYSAFIGERFKCCLFLTSDRTVAETKSNRPPELYVISYITIPASLPLLPYFNLSVLRPTRLLYMFSVSTVFFVASLALSIFVVALYINIYKHPICFRSPQALRPVSTNSSLLLVRNSKHEIFFSLSFLLGIGLRVV